MMRSAEGDTNENSDLFFVDVPPMGNGDRGIDSDDVQDEVLSQRLQAPPVPGSSGALIEEGDNAAALAELEDVPMAVKKRKSINRGPKLDTKRLLSARGLPAIPSYFEKVKLKGKNHEVEDLSVIMSTLEHWAHRLYPKLTFDDCLEKIESLGHKKEIQTCMKKIRMGMPILDDANQSTVITSDGPGNADADSEVEYGDDDELNAVMGDFLSNSRDLTPPNQQSSEDYLSENNGPSTSSTFVPDESAGPDLSPPVASVSGE